MLTTKRFFIIFVILGMTGIGGIFDTESLMIDDIPLFDFAILLCIIYFLYFHFFRISRNIVLAPIYTIVVLTTLVILSMPFRGEETILQAFQVGRHFYILLFAFIIGDNILEENNFSFVKSVIYIFGIYYSILTVLNYIAPTYIASFWDGIGTVQDIKGSTARSVLKANDGLLFVHLAFLLKGFDLLSDMNCRNKKNVLMFLFFSISIFFMGFRAIMIATFFSFIVVILLIKRASVQNELLNNANILKICFISIVLVLVINFILDNAVFGIISFAFDEITGKTSGTLQGRLNRSLVYQIPMILKEPLFGIGFVHVKSQMALDIGYIRDINYFKSIYYFDFGYGTLFAMFGLIGGGLIIYNLIRSAIVVLKISMNYLSSELLIFPAIIISLLVSNYSFGALEYPIGLIILSIVTGIAYAKIRSIIMEENN